MVIPVGVVYPLDNDKSLTQTYSPKILDAILKTEELLDKNLNDKVIEILKPIIKKKTLNDFEKSSLYFLFATAHFNLKSYLNANTSFLKVLTYDSIPTLLYLESLKKLSHNSLNREQKEFVLKRIRIIDDKQENIDLQLSLANFLYQSSDFNRTIETLVLVVQKGKNLTKSQSKKLNELLFLAYAKNSELNEALKVIETVVQSNPTKKNFRRLAYIYALLNETENHLNIWETINDNFSLDRYETRYFYELLLKRDFHSKAEQIFIYGIENSFFGPNDKLHNDSLNVRLKSIPISKED